MRIIVPAKYEKYIEELMAQGFKKIESKVIVQATKSIRPNPSKKPKDQKYVLLCNTTGT